MIAAAIAVTLGGAAVGAVLFGAEFYVAPTGKDSRPGTKEQPLATLEAARDAARKAEAGPHRIVLVPGEYFLDKPFELDARDNGLMSASEIIDGQSIGVNDGLLLRWHGGRSTGGLF